MPSSATREVRLHFLARLAILSVLTLFALPMFSQSEPTFGFNQTNFRTGQEALKIVVADFNKDGKLDIAESDFLDYTISIFLGNGDGTLQARQIYPIGSSGAYSIAVDDFNEDGNLDIVFSSATATASGILFGNGDGTLQPPSAFTGIVTSYLVAADFNNDGHLDLAMNTSLLLGNGNGTFQAPVKFSGDTIYGLDAADFNGDGKLDLVESRYLDVAIFLGNGDGTFVAGKNYYFDQDEGRGVLAADLNGDGIPDMAALSWNSAQYENGIVTLLFGNGDGTFGKSSTYNIPTEYYPSMATGDINGDGILDLFVNEGDGFVVNVLLGKGDGRYEQQIGNPGGGVSFALGDFNQDGKLDYASSTDYLTLSIFTQTAPTTVSITPTQIHFGKVKVGDYVSQDVTVTNTGDSLLVVSYADFPDDLRDQFVISSQSNCQDKTLKPGESCTVTPVFAPVRHHQLHSVLSIHDNGVGTPHNITVFGIGSE